jgi:hypothetical protein
MILQGLQELENFNFDPGAALLLEMALPSEFFGYLPSLKRT